MSELKFAVAKESPVPYATLPVQKTGRSAGLDLCGVVDAVVPPGGYVLLPTGLRFAEPLPADEVVILAARSSLFGKYGLMLTNGIGIIDADYPGQILVPLINVTGQQAIVPAGTPVAQALRLRYVQSETSFADVNDDAFAALDRTGGFGSTDAPAVERADA